MSTPASRVLDRFRLASALAISPELEQAIQTVSGHFKGARKAKFEKGLGVLRGSIAAGQWLPRGKATVLASVSGGLIGAKQMPPEHVMPGVSHDEHFSLMMSLVYGQVYKGSGTVPVELIKTPERVQQAWFKVCSGIRELCSVLDRIRPKPVLTEIELSPRVTKTLKEMGLDLDLSTVKVPPTEKLGDVPELDKMGKPITDRYGKPVMQAIYRVLWTTGTKFGLSRFAGSDCEACGKRIPSFRYVPIEVEGRKDGVKVHAGLRIGVDCAARIFGIKDKGYRIESQ